MTPSRKNVMVICDRLMQINPAQIIIDFIQDDVEEIVHGDDVTPDDIGAAKYQCSLLLEVYNPILKKDIAYLQELEASLKQWGEDATFANKTLGLDPNK